MNDNDIIKALEHCASSTTSEACNGCPLFSTTICTENGLQIYALDIINRQKAEIERLRAILEAAEDHYNPLPFKGIFDKKIAEAKTEATKEFAERLKSIRKGCSFTFYSNGHFCESIDSLVKEMTEEQE